MSEQLRFEQGLGDARAVYRHVAVLAAWSERMDTPGDDVFADAALASDQDLGVRSRHPGNFTPQQGNRRAVANKLPLCDILRQSSTSGGFEDVHPYVYRSSVAGL
jgi:hypothetical protein